MYLRLVSIQKLQKFTKVLKWKILHSCSISICTLGIYPKVLKVFTKKQKINGIPWCCLFLRGRFPSTGASSSNCVRHNSVVNRTKFVLLSSILCIYILLCFVLFCIVLLYSSLLFKLFDIYLNIFFIYLIFFNFDLLILFF